MNQLPTDISMKDAPAAIVGRTRIPLIMIRYVHPENGFMEFVKDLTNREEREWISKLLTWAAHSKIELRIIPCKD